MLLHALGEAPQPQCATGRKLWLCLLTPWTSTTLQGKIKKLEDIFLFSMPIKEYQIVEFFLGSALKDEVMKIMPVQKQTRAGQRTRFKVSTAGCLAYLKFCCYRHTAKWQLDACHFWASSGACGCAAQASQDCFPGWLSTL